jgi:hypothetical protein
LATVNSFFDNQSKLKDSDDNHQAFAEYQLESFHFLYKDADGNDPKVSNI